MAKTLKLSVSDNCTAWENVKPFWCLKKLFFKSKISLTSKWYYHVSGCYLHEISQVMRQTNPKIPQQKAQARLKCFMISRTSQTYLFGMTQYRDTCMSWDIVSSVCKKTEMIESCFYAGKIIRIIYVRNNGTKIVLWMKRQLSV